MAAQDETACVMSHDLFWRASEANNERIESWRPTDQNETEIIIIIIFRRPYWRLR